jgi:hypothetical protein
MCEVTVFFLKNSLSASCMCVCWSVPPLSYRYEYYRQELTSMNIMPLDFSLSFYKLSDVSSTNILVMKTCEVRGTLSPFNRVV